MAEITAQLVKALRERTDMPMMKCKQALVEADGDLDKAVEILKREAGRVLDKRAENPTAEGRIFIQVKDDGSEAVMIEVQCESAPVAGGEDFLRFGDLLTSRLLEGPGAQTPDELLSQPSPDESGKTLQELYEDMVGTIREKIIVARCTRVDGPVAGYVHHDGKTGVLFQASGENATAPVIRDVAMHVAAWKPAVLDIEDVDPAAVQAERDRLAEQVQGTGKPANIIEKIVEGRLKNFYVEQAGVLVLQPFAKDDSKTVSQALAESGLKAAGFTCWVIGSS